MPSSFTTLPNELHLEIAAYLPWSDSKNVSQSCSKVRKIYQISSWKNCVVSTKKNPHSDSFMEYRTYRCALENMLVYPSKYTTWFRPESIENIKFDKEFMDWYECCKPEDEPMFKQPVSVSFQSLQRVLIDWIECHELIKELNESFRNSIEISIIPKEINWSVDFGNRYMSSIDLKFVPTHIYGLERFYNSMRSLTNLTKLSMTPTVSGLVENTITFLNQGNLPSLQDISFQLDIALSEENTIISNYNLRDLILVNNMTFVKKLKYFELKLVLLDRYRGRGLTPFYYTYHDDNVLYDQNNEPITIIELLFVTHLKIAYRKPAYDFDLVFTLFSFPKVNHLVLDWWKFTGKLNNLQLWDSSFSNLSDLSLQIDLTFNPKTNEVSSINQILFLKSLVNLKTLSLSISGSWQVQHNLYTRSIGKFHDIFEGSVFSQIYKIFHRSFDIYENKNSIEYSNEISELVSKEFPYILPIMDEEMKQNSLEPPLPLDNNLFQAQIRGFFIHWIHVLLLDPEEFFKNFFIDYVKFSEGLFDSDLKFEPTKKTQEENNSKYIQLGQRNKEFVAYQNQCKLLDIATLLFQIGYIECIFSFLPSCEKLEYLQFSAYNDIVPSPNFNHYIQNSKSLKQALIYSRIMQPFNGMTQYLDSSELAPYLSPHVDNDLAHMIQNFFLGQGSLTSLEEGIATVKNEYKLDRVVSDEEKKNLIGIKSLDTDIIFPTVSPKTGQRKIFWNGLIVQCSKDEEIGLQPSPHTSSDYCSYANVFYLFNNTDSGEFNNTIDIGAQLGIENYIDNYHIRSLIYKTLPSCFSNREVFNGWV